MPHTDRVAVLGTGLMGAPMARRLLERGFTVTVWNRSADRALAIASDGAAVATSAAAAIAAADAVLVMLSDGAAVAEVLLEPASRHALEGRTVVQSSTVAPQENRDLARAVEAAGGRYLEAPVLGSIPQAMEGTLLVMVGGDEALMARWRPLLEALGRQPRLVGAVGQASVLKLAMNQLIASLTAAYALSLELVRAGGVEVDAFVDTVRASALHAPTFDKKLDMMLSGDFSAANFPLKHLLKDVRLVVAEAEHLGLETAAAAGVASVIERAMALGLADADYSALAAGIGPAHPARS